MMKSILSAAVICLSVTSVNAADVVLAAGAKAYIKAGEAAVVACEGSSSNLPACAVGKTTYSSDPCSGGSDRIQVKVGSDVLECAKTVDDAIARIATFRAGGLCK